MMLLVFVIGMLFGYFLGWAGTKYVRDHEAEAHMAKCEPVVHALEWALDNIRYSGPGGRDAESWARRYNEAWDVLLGQAWWRRDRMSFPTGGPK